MPVDGVDGWYATHITDPNLGFPQLNLGLLVLLCIGLYQIKCANKYATVVREEEVDTFLAENPEYEDIDWDDFNAFSSTLSDEKIIFFKDEIDEPGNWNAKDFQKWYKRRFVFASIPSLHTKKVHKVILAFIPTDWHLPAGFQNRFGFVGPLQRLVGYGCLPPTCKSGLRTLGACGHTATLVTYLGMFAYDEELFKTTHKDTTLYHVTNNPSLNKKLLRPLQQPQQQQPQAQQPPHEGGPPAGANGNIPVLAPGHDPGPDPQAAGQAQVPPGRRVRGAVPDLCNVQ